MGEKYLTEPQITKLVRQYRNACSLADRDKAYESLLNCAQVQQVIKSVCARYRLADYDEHDKYQICSLLLLKAIESYDPKLGAFKSLFHIICNRKCDSVYKSQFQVKHGSSNHTTVSLSEDHGDNDDPVDLSDCSVDTTEADPLDAASTNDALKLLRELLGTIRLSPLERTVYYTYLSNILKGAADYPSIVEAVARVLPPCPTQRMALKQADNAITRAKRKIAKHEKAIRGILEGTQTPDA